MANFIFSASAYVENASAKQLTLLIDPSDLKIHYQNKMEKDDDLL